MGKPDPDGYKIWALAWKGYLYDWLYYSGTEGTSSVVRVFWLSMHVIHLTTLGLDSLSGSLPIGYRSADICAIRNIRNR